MKFICVGDVALGDHPKTVGHGVYSRYPSGIPNDKVRRLFPPDLDPDIIFGNLEYELSEDNISGHFLNDSQCRGINKYGEFLENAGFNVLNVASNHISQYGYRPFNRTVQILNNHKIVVCGTKDDFTGEKIIEKNGVRIGFIGWSLRPRQYSNSTPPYNEFDESRYYNDIVALKIKVDILIISVHWGSEFIQAPSPYEEKIARKMIEAGANAIIGHHPHVLRRIEEYNNGLIAYSLGNFVCDMSWEKRTMQTGILFFEINDDKIRKWIFYPYVIGKDFFPYRLDSKNSSVFFEEFNYLLKNLHKDIKKCGYKNIVERELKKHKIASLKYFLKNIFRYKFHVSCKVIINAFKDRLSSLYN